MFDYIVQVTTKLTEDKIICVKQRKEVKKYLSMKSVER